MTKTVKVLGLKGFPLVKPGDDIVQLILKTAKSLSIKISDGDVIVVGHKVVSKSEGRIARLSGVKPSGRAVNIARATGKDPRVVQLILNEAKRIIKIQRNILLVETKRGVVCLNAGIDKSNVEGNDSYCLLPANPSRSARRIAREILNETGAKVRVVVSDTYSRPFRAGQSEFAIGTSGFNPFVDYRGTRDLFGKTLRFKFVSIADELASAAELVMGQGSEGVPCAIIKGVCRMKNDRRSLARLIMRRNRDLFRDAL
jgi:coenzyme F420-0:L-glutamate ligase/coenzyme F420-1:gamma-L-glutamate ligase